MIIRERKINDITVLDLEGTFALGDQSAFSKQIETLIDGGNRKLLINFAKLNYLDSSGLGELVASYMGMRQVKGEIKLVNINQRLHDLMVITKLVTVFETFDSEPSAIFSFTIPPKL